MSRCSECNKTIPNGSKFCNFCGGKQESTKKKNKYYVRPDGLHECIKTINGKRIPFRGKTDAEVDRKMLEWKQAAERGRLFQTVADEWKAEHFKDDNVSYNTQKAYKKPFERITEAFKDKPVKDITPKDIDAWIKAIAKRWGIKTVKKHRTVANQIFAHAVVSGDIEYSPCAYVALPKAKASTRRELPEDGEIEKVKNNIGLPYGFLHYLVLYTGLRRGEALALKYGDIDLDKNEIHVRRSLYYRNATPTEKEPKTVNGIRTVPILDALREHLSAGEASEYIFPLEYKTTLERHLKQYRKKAKIKCTLHQLRHGFATICYDAEIDVKQAQEYLGHANLSMTQEIYTHISEKRRINNAQKLNDYVNLQNTQKVHSATDEPLQ